jgi:transcriptional regulator with XRE-family HTH domain
MTQQELAVKISVQRAQVSKIESEKYLTIATIARYLKAVGLEASLSVTRLGGFFAGIFRVSYILFRIKRETV